MIQRKVPPLLDLEIGTERTAWEGPEERTLFRVAQLCILLSKAEESNTKLTNLDRMAYFDFFAANPFVVLDGESVEKDNHDRLTLRLLGFSDRQLNYGAVGHRFVTRRKRIQHDFAFLVARGLAQLLPDGYAITERGVKLATSLTTVYAEAYRTAASIVFRRFGKLSEKKLRAKAEKLLGAPWLLIDFFADVEEFDATVPGGDTTTWK